MNMAGEQRITASRERVWEALNDPEVLRASIPGCHSLVQVGDDRYTATVDVKVGPIGARFKGAVVLQDLNPPYGYTLVLEGNGGIAGSVKGSARVRLGEEAGVTPISYDIDAQLGGRMAQLGGSLIDATAKQLAGKFFGRFGEIVGGELAPFEVAAAAPAAALGGAPHRSAAPALSTGMSMALMLAAAVAVLAGFVVGRGQGAPDSEWAGLAIGLLLIAVAGVSFEFGRRSATPVLVLDNALLRRLLERAKE